MKRCLLVKDLVKNDVGKTPKIFDFLTFLPLLLKGMCKTKNLCQHKNLHTYKCIKELNRIHIATWTAHNIDPTCFCMQDPCCQFARIVSPS